MHEFHDQESEYELRVWGQINEYCDQEPEYELRVWGQLNEFKWMSAVIKSLSMSWECEVESMSSVIRS